MRQPSLQNLEAEFFRNLNQVVEPLVRAGFGSPAFWPTAAIVLEATGRKTGQTLRVPLLATRWGEFVIVSTVRRRSHWLRNLAANAEVGYWLGGERHEATAFVIAADPASSPSANETLAALPPRAACLARWLQQQSQWFGIRFAILSPRT